VDVDCQQESNYTTYCGVIHAIKMDDTPQLFYLNSNHYYVIVIVDSTQQRKHLINEKMVSQHTRRTEVHYLRHYVYTQGKGLHSI
jgi:negative regulator of genetic competence, sporulation and motility